MTALADERVGLSDTIITVTINYLFASPQSSEVHEVCDQLQKMGYAQSKRIRIYGQEFEAVSNPFPNGEWHCHQSVFQAGNHGPHLTVAAARGADGDAAKKKKSSLALSANLSGDSLSRSRCISLHRDFHDLTN